VGVEGITATADFDGDVVAARVARGDRRQREVDRAFGEPPRRRHLDEVDRVTLALVEDAVDRQQTVAMRGAGVAAAVDRDPTGAA
jgi:hypothetical protein